MHEPRAVMVAKWVGTVMTDIGTQPEQPQGVRLERADGTVLPLQMTYMGEEDGVHMWQTVEGSPGFRQGDALRADIIPARTGLLIGWEVEP